MTDPNLADIGTWRPYDPHAPQLEGLAKATFNVTGNFSGQFNPEFPDRIVPVTYVYPRPWWRKLLFLPARKRDLGMFRMVTEVTDGEITMRGERI